MDVTPLVKAGSKIIQSYRGGAFIISQETYKTPVIVTQGTVIEWPCQAIDAKTLSEQDMAFFSEIKEIDTLLLGVGKTMAFPRPEIRSAFKTLPFAVEAMDTGAACRTYNVLMAEGRRVAAALLLY